MPCPRRLRPTTKQTIDQTGVSSTGASTLEKASRSKSSRGPRLTQPTSSLAVVGDEPGRRVVVGGESFELAPIRRGRRVGPVPSPEPEVGAPAPLRVAARLEQGREVGDPTLGERQDPQCLERWVCHRPSVAAVVVESRQDHASFRGSGDPFDALRTSPYAGHRAGNPHPTFGVSRGRHLAAAGPVGLPPGPPEPRSIVELVRLGTLDAELAATLWLLIEARVPLVVAAAATGTGKSTLLDALLDFLPPGTHAVELAGAAETFDWLPQAPELGWRRPPPSPGGHRVRPPVRPDTTVLLIPELSDHLPAYTWGAEARIAIRAASIGYGLAATIHADSLDEVFEALRRPPVQLADDELSRLGVVLVLRAVAGGRRRVVAAHYIRPVVRDVHGHVQRLGPAVLATWDPGRDGFEHFAWGIVPELAARIDRRAGDFEIEIDRRRDYLAGLVTAGVIGVEDVRHAIDGYRLAAASGTSAAAVAPN